MSGQYEIRPDQRGDKATLDFFDLTKDIYDFRNNSLIETYKQIWVKSQGLRHGNGDTKDLMLAFDKLKTFPFVSVVNLMSDYMRDLLRNQLGFLGNPYTNQHLEAIDRLLTKYPDNTDTIKQLDNVNTLVDDLYQLLQNELVLVHQVSAKLVDLIEVIYQIPSQYLWERLPKVYALIDTLMNQVKSSWFNDHHALDALHQYLKLQVEQNTTPSHDMETQYVRDVSLLLQWNYPHPEVILAMEKAFAYMKMKYTQTEINKLFITNVVGKIKTLLKQGEQIDFMVMNWFKRYRLGEIEVEMESLTEEAKAEAVYQRLKEEVVIWQLYGQNKQALSEVLAKVKAIPMGLLFRFTDLRHLINQAEEALLK